MWISESAKLGLFQNWQSLQVGAISFTRNLAITGLSRCANGVVVIRHLIEEFVYPLVNLNKSIIYFVGLKGIYEFRTFRDTEPN